MLRSAFPVLFAAALLAGCASKPYQPTERQVSLSKQYSAEEAVQIVGEASRDIARATKYGICAASVKRDHDSPVTVDAQGIHFKAYHKGEFIKADARYRYYEKDAYTAHFNFGDMNEIAYQDNRDGAALACAGNFLITTAGKEGIVLFGVPGNKVDALLAALIKLAPQAKLTQTRSF